VSQHSGNASADRRRPVRARTSASRFAEFRLCFDFGGGTPRGLQRVVKQAHDYKRVARASVRGAVCKLLILKVDEKIDCEIAPGDRRLTHFSTGRILPQMVGQVKKLRRLKTESIHPIEIALKPCRYQAYRTAARCTARVGGRSKQGQGIGISAEETRHGLLCPTGTTRPGPFAAATSAWR
jgi:hypothetical protein